MLNLNFSSLRFVKKWFLYFFRGVCKQFGANTGRITLAVLLISPGMFISSTAFLPSSFCMYMTLLSMGAWFQEHLQVRHICLLLSPLTGIKGLAVRLSVRCQFLDVNLGYCLNLSNEMTQKESLWSDDDPCLFI